MRTSPEPKPIHVAGLNELEQETWLRLVAACMAVMPQLERDLQKAGQLSFFDFRVLDNLFQARDPLTMSELAIRCNSSLSRLSHVARKLEARELMERFASSGDRRVTMAQLTPEGVELVEKMSEDFGNSLRGRVFDHLDEGCLTGTYQSATALLRANDPGHWLLAQERDVTEACLN